MNPEGLFTAFNIAIIPFWLLLIFAPRWIWTDRIVHSIALPIALLGILGLLLYIVIRIFLRRTLTMQETRLGPSTPELPGYASGR